MSSFHDCDGQDGTYCQACLGSFVFISGLVHLVENLEVMVPGILVELGPLPGLWSTELLASVRTYLDSLKPPGGEGGGGGGGCDG